jgi:chromate reductase, NAD(P)H dehydrogenase (quinone)
MNEPQAIRILGISGSLRSASFGAAILNGLQERSLPGMEFSVRTIEDIPFYNKDLDVQPALQPIADFRSKVAGSDGIVIATPGYNHGVPGVLKNTLDWASRPAFASCFQGKPVLIISSASAFTGGVQAQYQLRETLTSILARTFSGREIVVGGVNAKMSQGRFTDEESLAFTATGLNRLHEEVLSQRAVAQ